MLIDQPEKAPVGDAPDSALSTRRAPNKTQPLHVVQLADALLRIATVADWTGLGRSTIYRKSAEGEFPKPVRLGGNCSRWKAADVRAWIAAQEAA
jgi:prophage regulatory protein